MLFSEFINELRCIISEDIQEEWDNSGIQIKTDNSEIRRVLVALEITSDVIDEAVEKDVQLIITHHPLLFNGMKTVDTDNASGRYITRLVRNGINVYSCHTNFDKMAGGNNDYICDILDLDEVGILFDEEFTRCGYCPERTLRETAELLADKLETDISQFHIVGDPEQKINFVGLCTGAGAEYIGAAALCGCDLYVTGDLKHHEAREAEELGIAVIDAGHYGTEKIFPKAFISVMTDNEFTYDIDFIESECCNNPFNLLK
ncbi:MAG: Nif3-like dinuclear metal center hexameric protein [Firmicutes bacterium]|nr:Nif3-like dinuclear metal center hexameric protein [Bacillota bacterium]